MFDGELSAEIQFARRTEVSATICPAQKGEIVHLQRAAGGEVQASIPDENPVGALRTIYGRLALDEGAPAPGGGQVAPADRIVPAALAREKAVARDVAIGIEAVDVIIGLACLHALGRPEKGDAGIHLGNGQATEAQLLQVVLYVALGEDRGLVRLIGTEGFRPQDTVVGKVHTGKVWDDDRVLVDAQVEMGEIDPCLDGDLERVASIMAFQFGLVAVHDDGRLVGQLVRPVVFGQLPEGLHTEGVAHDRIVAAIHESGPIGRITG